MFMLNKISESESESDNAVIKGKLLRLLRTIIYLG